MTFPVKLAKAVCAELEATCPSGGPPHQSGIVGRKTCGPCDYPSSSGAWNPSSGELKPNTPITLLRSSDPEPPVGVKVRTSEGTVYRRSSLDDRRCWFPEGDDDDPESWTRVAGNYGPVALVED